MRWPHYTHIFFDCDSTLTTVEGIDILARSTGNKEHIEALTNAAMDGKIDLSEVYGRRLETIKPTRGDVRAIRRSYKQNIVEDAREVIATLQASGAQVFIISGGLYEPVKEFGISLGVPEDHIRAVGLMYNALSGQWWRENGRSHADSYIHYEKGALTVSNGKADIVRDLLRQVGAERNGRSLLIGDGTSDLIAQGAVNLFVGYGGVIIRERVLAEAPAFIHSRSLAPLLSLALGPAGLIELRHGAQQELVDKALEIISKGEITFTNEHIKRKFEKAYQAVLARSN